MATERCRGFASGRSMSARTPRDNNPSLDSSGPNRNASSSQRPYGSPNWSSTTGGSGRVRASRGGVTPNAMVSTSPSLTTRDEISREWSGVSYLKDRAGHGNLSRVNDSGYRDYAVPGPVIQGMDTVSASKVYPPRPGGGHLHSNSSQVSSDRVWHNQVFPALQPAGRGDVRRLRQWLEASLEQLDPEAYGAGDIYGFTEQALKLYNLTFHELTRQVSVNCVERGRLMADVWTSHAELTGRVLTNLINEKGGNEAMIASLRMENHEMKGELEELRMKLKIKDGECQQQKVCLSEMEQLSMRHKYKGESWEEQEEEWRRMEEASAAKSAEMSGGAKDQMKKKAASFFMSAKAMKAEAEEAEEGDGEEAE